MSRGEETLALHIRALRLPAPEREVALIPGRRYRWDFVWRTQRIALEVQGGIWRKSGHTTGTGITRDCEKANLAALAGYRTLFVTTDMVDRGEAVIVLQRALGAPERIVRTTRPVSAGRA